MLYFGTTFNQQQGSPLKEISLRDLHQKITDPGTDLENQVNTLRNMLAVDKEAYHRAKAKLPYFIGATFKEGIRRAENFKHIDWLILDFDGCVDAEHSAEEWKEILSDDRQVALMFVSPGGNGIKCVFRLSEPLTNSKIYSDFYQDFARRFAAHYSLEEKIDLKTHDVSRVCFLSHDPEAFIQEDAEPVDWQAIAANRGNYGVPETDWSILEDPEQKLKKKEEKANKEKKGSGDPSDDVYQDILKKLGGRTKKPAKEYYVPAQLDEITEPVKKEVAKYGIELSEVSDISYGRRFRFVLKDHFAEINIFFGKNGFSVVPTTKRGSHKQLTKIVTELTRRLLYKQEELDDPFVKKLLDDINLN